MESEADLDAVIQWKVRSEGKNSTQPIQTRRSVTAQEVGDVVAESIAPIGASRERSERELKQGDRDCKNCAHSGAPLTKGVCL